MTQDNGNEIRKCFFISPIGDAGSDTRRHADMTLNLIVRPVLEAPEFAYRVVRGDEASDPGMISDHMIADILDAPLCIADLTFVNPNVFYEVGLRHMASKPIIHMAMVGTKIPFDNFGHRAVFFDPNDWHQIVAARSELEKAVAALAVPGYKVSNPVTQARGVQQLGSSKDDRDQILKDLVMRFDAMERRLVDVEPRQPRLSATDSSSVKAEFQIPTGKLSIVESTSGDFLLIETLADTGRKRMITRTRTLETAVRRLQERIARHEE